MASIKKLMIEKEKNPEYYSILEKHNVLMKEWNQINNKIHSLKVPKLFIWKNKDQLKEIFNELTQLEKDYIDWNNIAYPFISSPNYVIPNCPESNLIFLHFTANLRDLRNKMSDDMRLIENNYNHFKNWQSNQVNFIIAISSFVLSIVGLIIALLTVSPQRGTEIKSSVKLQEIRPNNAISLDTFQKNQNDSSITKQQNKKTALK
jgi:hypothetical protein